MKKLMILLAALGTCCIAWYIFTDDTDGVRKGWY